MAKENTFYGPGATKRFMSINCAESMGYKFENGEEMNVFGFNQEKPASFTSHKIKFEIKLEDGSVRTLSANTVPKFTNPLKILKLDQNDEYPIPMISGAEKTKPDILLNIEDFWNLFQSYRKLSSGWRLIKTKIGSLLCCRPRSKKSPLNLDKKMPIIHTPPESPNLDKKKLNLS